MTHVVLVVPCFNEASRLDLGQFESLLVDEAIHLSFVDDGSTDDTLTVLRRFAATRPDRVGVVALARNAGKGEAVRVGLRRALEDGAPWVGFADADLATPPSELRRLVGVALAGDRDVIMGCRVARAGAAIERRPVRHYLGRVFATYASVVLDAAFYDTQCGAKLFRASPTLVRALSEPFDAGWVFDLELLGRLRYDPIRPIGFGHFLEVPLDVWEDVGGSHIRPSSLPSIALGVMKATSHVAALRRTYRRTRSRRAD